MPFAEDLADLVDKDLLESVDDQELSASVGESERNERSMITSKVGTASGGINTASMSRNTGGSGIAGRSTTQVASPVAGLEAQAGGARRTGRKRQGCTFAPGNRTRVRQEQGCDLRALQSCAQRQDPTLQGKVVLRLTISPTGEVTFCEIVSSELGDPDLERKLVLRVKQFRFDAKNVEPITTTKPIDFFPA